MHTTTLNIKEEIYELMEDWAREMDIPVSVLIKQLIARFSKRYTSRLEYRECSVTYQPLSKNRKRKAGRRKQSVKSNKKGKKQNWHLFTITYTDEEYEQVLDLRKVWKLSVSFFVRMAFLHYYYCVESGNALGSGDAAEIRARLGRSYMLTKYEYRKNIVKNTIVFALIWNKPRTCPCRE